MASEVSRARAAWLLENGPRELELLFRAVVQHASTPIVIANDEHVDGNISTGVQDYALFLLDVNGHIAAWYSGAARIYGYSADEADWQTRIFSLSRRR